MIVFSNQINIATLAMEDIKERLRLCWLYTTVQSTIGYDDVDNSYLLPDLPKMSEGHIPYPEQFAH